MSGNDEMSGNTEDDAAERERQEKVREYLRGVRELNRRSDAANNKNPEGVPQGEPGHDPSKQ